jgi:23S rRNA (guanosine2251-2'-O)-methyltransferase
MKHDSQAYLERKRFFDSLITIYGRHSVMEALQDETITCHKLHLSKSNKPDGIIKKMIALAESKGVEIEEHDKEKLSRISKNAKQDQGVAADIVASNYKEAASFFENAPSSYRLLALDGIHNPQNLGMIIRSAAAGNIDGILLPKKGSAKLSPLVMKASAGTLFKIDILYCDSLEDVLEELDDTAIYALSSHAKQTIHDLTPSARSIFVLGNESEGVSDAVTNLCNASLGIPMNRGVESLNVAVTAALIAFMR